MRRELGAWLLVGALTSACGDEEVQVTGKRGAPGGQAAKGGAAKKAPNAASAPARAGTDPGDVEGEDEPALPPRPPIVLDTKSFSRARDPFRRFVVGEKVELQPDKPRAQRKVIMPEYAFEDLKLVAIVNSGRSIVPRALFVGSDGRSKAVRQGEYFSSAEVLLAAVNRDYVEIEIVDEELASSLNMQRGDRRAIYLRNE
jgi:Tfp pilus assembly protein PilP